MKNLFLMFENGVILVTRTETGMGFASANAFAEAGVSVVLADVNEKALEDAFAARAASHTER